MIRKGQVRNIDGGDIRAQAEFIAGLYHRVASYVISLFQRRPMASAKSLQRNHVH
jgi:hypothetical protein